MKCVLVPTDMFQAGFKSLAKHFLFFFAHICTTGVPHVWKEISHCRLSDNVRVCCQCKENLCVLSLLVHLPASQRHKGPFVFVFWGVSSQYPLPRKLVRILRYSAMIFSWLATAHDFICDKNVQKLQTLCKQLADRVNVKHCTPWFIIPNFQTLILTSAH